VTKVLVVAAPAAKRQDTSTTANTAGLGFASYAAVRGINFAQTHPSVTNESMARHHLNDAIGFAETVAMPKQAKTSLTSGNVELV